MDELKAQGATFLLGTKVVRFEEASDGGGGFTSIGGGDDSFGGGDDGGTR